jgi:hypothetical protein
MKSKILSLSALAIAALFAFAFKAAPMKAAADQIFVRAAGASVTNPLSYSTGTANNCPDVDFICAIDLFDSDVYTLAEAVAAGNAAWANHPKVNVPTPPAGSLAADLPTAVASSVDNQVINGRTYFKRDTN